LSADIPRARDGRAPDVFERGGWVPMREFGDEDEVDFLIVGAGAGGATLACKLAEAHCSVVVVEAGPFWRPLDDFASDEFEQQKLYWLDDRVTAGADPIALGGNNSGRGVGGSTVHFSMISLRFRPEWFECRSKLGYGFDWPLRYEEVAPYYAEVEDALKVAGPVRYPWGPRRKRYPYRARRSPPFPRPADAPRPASIAASATSAARRMRSRARLPSGFHARFVPAPRCATWRWPQESTWIRVAVRMAFITFVRIAGTTSAPATSRYAATQSKHRACC